MARVKFYNAGVRISENLAFSISSNTQAAEGQSVGRYSFDAPKEDFFFVPTELPLVGGGRLPVYFADNISTKFGKRGCVRIIDVDFAEQRGWRAPESIDKEFEACKAADFRIPVDQDGRSEPFAFSEQDAMERGRALWKQYCHTVASAHIEEALQARAMGGVLRRASGFTAYALEVSGLLDPAEEAFDALKKKGTEQRELAETKAEVAKLQKMVEQLLTAQGATADVSGRPNRK